MNDIIAQCMDVNWPWAPDQEQRDQFGPIEAQWKGIPVPPRYQSINDAFRVYIDNRLKRLDLRLDLAAKSGTDTPTPDASLAASFPDPTAFSKWQQRYGCPA